MGRQKHKIQSEEMENDFESERNGYVARIEENTDHVDDGFVRKRGREEERKREKRKRR